MPRGLVAWRAWQSQGPGGRAKGTDVTVWFAGKGLDFLLLSVWFPWSDRSGRKVPDGSVPGRGSDRLAQQPLVAPCMCIQGALEQPRSNCVAVLTHECFTIHWEKFF